MGLLADHTFLAALEAYFNLTPAKGKICCDNKGVLYKSQLYRCQIPVGASQGDIKRALHNVKLGLKAALDYGWVKSHKDCYKLWHHLSLEQHINCF